MARKKSESLRERLRVTPGRRLALTDELADSTPGVDGRDVAVALLELARERLRELQYQLYADGRFGLLVVLQAMDAGGKDGTIRNVFSAFNPQGCHVAAFKVPSDEELKHDFLWRIHRAAPGRGEVGVFNRSHYEDVLVVRVDNLAPKAVWSKRYEQINDFERTLDANDIRVVKFFLHISKEEQRERLKARLEDPHKLWKFDPRDLGKRKQWNAYRQAYEDAIARCSTEQAPWYVIPADRKWYRNYAVARILVETLEDLPLRWPPAKVDPKKIVIR
jgi:PPK2 family polyphosphate:nucleotide phosphotransferase